MFVYIYIYMYIYKYIYIHVKIRLIFWSVSERIKIWLDWDFTANRASRESDILPRWLFV